MALARPPRAGARAALGAAAPPRAAAPPPPPPGWLSRARRVSAADVRFLFDEVHVRRCYLQRGVALAPGATVVDVGANIGMAATFFAEEVGATGSVVALEPLPPTHAALAHNVALHAAWCAAAGRPCAPVATLEAGAGDGSARRAEFTLFPRAAGWGTMAEADDETIQRDMAAFVDGALDDAGGASGALPPLAAAAGRALRAAAPWLLRLVVRAAVWWLLAGRRRYACALTTVSEVINEYGLEKVDLLKIDVERAELAVLRGVEARHWPRVAQVAAEAHAEDLAAAAALLRAAGFDVEAVQDGALRGTSIWMLYCTRSSSTE
jgi:hypothetical protein